MARKAGGVGQLAEAREALRTAKTAAELRAAQAVVLPLELGLSLAQTAKAIGRSVGATCTLRTRYCQVARHEREAPRPKRMLRNRANATLEREARILDEVLENAMRGVSSSFHRSRGRSRNDSASRWRYRRSIACWRAMAGGSWHRIRPIRKETLRSARTGKNFRGSWAKS